MVVRELVALLGIKTDKKGQKQAEGGMKRLISLAKVAAAAFVAFKIGKGLMKLAEKVAKIGDRFDKMSLKSGVAFETLQGLDHAAALAGASLGDVETAFKKLQASQVDAGEGLKTYTREFDRLGVEIKDSEGEFRDTEDLFFDIADAMQDMESDAERTAVAVKLLGRSGTNLIPMLTQGSGAIREQMKEMQELGAVMGPEMRENSVKFIDNQRRIDMMMQGVHMTMAEKLLPVFIKMQEASIKWWKSNRPWIKQNIAPIFKGIAIAIGKTVKVITRLVKWGAKLANNLPTAAKIAILVAAFLKWGTALKILLSPLGKIAILVGLLILIFDDLFTWVDGGDSVFGRLFDTLDELTGLPIGDFMKEIIMWFQRLAEDPVAAFEELVGVIHQSLIWWGEFFKEIWADIVAWFEVNAVGKISTIWSVLSNTLLFPFLTLLNFITDIFEVGISGALDRVFGRIKTWASNVWEVIKAPFQALNQLSNMWNDSGDSGGAAGASSPTLRGARAVIGAQGRPRSAAQVAQATKARAGQGGASQVITHAPVNHISIPIQAAPGMNEQRLASSVQTQVRRELDRQNRQAMKAIKPKVATAS